MVRRPMPILEVLYEPRDGPRGAGGVAHLDRKIQEYSDVQSLDCLQGRECLTFCESPATLDTFFFS
jgi:hypothetical protein